MTYMPKFSYFWTLSKWPKSLGDVLARGLSIVLQFLYQCSLKTQNVAVAGGGGGGRFCFACPAGFSSPCDFFFFSFAQNKGGPAPPLAPPLDPQLRSESKHKFIQVALQFKQIIKLACSC